MSLLSLLVSSCANLSIPDVPVCKELLPIEAYCTWTMSNRKQFVNDTTLLNGQTWWQHRVTIVSVPASSYAEFKKFFVKACEKYPQVCKEYDAQTLMKNIEQVNSYEIRLP